MSKRSRKHEADLDAAINQLFKELAGHDGHTDEYKNASDQLEKLMTLRADTSPRRVSPDTLVMAGTNLAGILMIISYEKAHVIATKAISFVLRPS